MMDALNKMEVNLRPIKDRSFELIKQVSEGAAIRRDEQDGFHHKLVALRDELAETKCQ